MLTDILSWFYSVKFSRNAFFHIPSNSAVTLTVDALFLFIIRVCGWPWVNHALLRVPTVTVEHGLCVMSRLGFHGRHQTATYAEIRQSLACGDVTWMLVCFSGVARLRNREKRLLASYCRSAWNNSAPIGRIFMKLCIGDFFESLSRKFKFH
jgi:hypothetical protein